MAGYYLRKFALRSIWELC